MEDREERWSILTMEHSHQQQQKQQQKQQLGSNATLLQRDSFENKTASRGYCVEPDDEDDLAERFFAALGHLWAVTAP